MDTCPFDMVNCCCCGTRSLVSYYFLIKNFKKFFIAAHRAAAPTAHRKSMDNITGGFAAGAA